MPPGCDEERRCRGYIISSFGDDATIAAAFLHPSYASNRERVGKLEGRLEHRLAQARRPRGSRRISSDRAPRCSRSERSSARAADLLHDRRSHQTVDQVIARGARARRAPAMMSCESMV